MKMVGSNKEKRKDGLIEVSLRSIKYLKPVIVGHYGSMLAATRGYTL